MFSIIILSKFSSTLYSFYSVSEDRKVNFEKILFKIFKILNIWP